VRCTCMGKKPFTTRIDDAVLDLAQRLAEAERRSVTSLIEVAILEYAERRGEPPPGTRNPSKAKPRKTTKMKMRDNWVMRLGS
jgi:hypothetical protein